MDSNQEVNSMYRDIDLNMPCFEEEELSSDVESTENHFSSLIQNNATPQLSQVSPLVTHFTYILHSILYSI